MLTKIVTRMTMDKFHAAGSKLFLVFSLKSKKTECIYFHICT